MRKRVVPKLTSLKLELPTCHLQTTGPATEAPNDNIGDGDGETLSSDEEDYNIPQESPARKRAFSEGAGYRSPSDADGRNTHES